MSDNECDCESCELCGDEIAYRELTCHCGKQFHIACMRRYGKVKEFHKCTECSESLEFDVEYYDLSHFSFGLEVIWTLRVLHIEERTQRLLIERRDRELAKRREAIAIRRAKMAAVAHLPLCKECQNRHEEEIKCCRHCRVTGHASSSPHCSKCRKYGHTKSKCTYKPKWDRNA